MDEWQSEALKTFPELQGQVNRTHGGIHGLWADIYSAMVAAYRATPANDDFIRRVYEYAAWCVRQPQTGDAETDLSNATAVGCKTLFLYHMSEEEYGKLHSDFIRKKEGVTRAPVL